MNRQWLLARKPPGGLPTDEDFTLSEAPVPEPGPHQMLTRTIYLSLDPYQWGRRRSGIETVGEVCHGRTVSQVVKSRLAPYTEGDFVFNTNGWQSYGLTGDGISIFGYMTPRKLDPAQATEAELRGQELFFGKSQCGTCHPVPYYTDNLMHNFKTERFYQPQMINGRMASADGPIKTFPLRGIKDSPPYLHDDRLLTLEDTVEFFSLVTQVKLTGQEKQDLVAFMRAL